MSAELLINVTPSESRVALIDNGILQEIHIELGGIFLPELFKLFMEPGAATQTGSALASMAIYILMSLVLIWRPTGLFGARA